MPGSEPTNAKTLTKYLAMHICWDAIAKVMRNVCATSREFQIPIDEDAGETAGSIVAAIGSGAVLVGTASVQAGGVARRVAIVRLSVGMLTTSLTVNNASQFQKAAFQIEHVAAINSKAVSKVAIDMLNGSPTKTIKAMEEVSAKSQDLKAIKVAGESIKSLSKIVSHAMVAFAIIDAIYQINAELGGKKDVDRITARRRDCCEAITQAADSAWKKAGEIFHRGAMKTDDKKRRAYGRRTSRR